MKFYRDIISGLSGHPMSGLWTLAFKGERVAHIGSGHGVRALARAFGASEGSGDLREKIDGQEIVWHHDDMGLVIGGFTPINEWTGPDGFDDNGVLEWDPEADDDPVDDPAFLVEVVHTVRRPGRGKNWQRRGDKTVTPCATLAEVRALLLEEYGACKTRFPIYVDRADGTAKRTGTIFSRLGSEIKGTGRRAKLFVRDWVRVFALVGRDDDGQPQYEYKPVTRLQVSPTQ